MKKLPIFFRIILNIFLYLVYVVFFWFLFGLIFPIILKALDMTILNPMDTIFDKIAIILAIIILLLTIFLRKYFYISLENIDNIKKEEKIIVKKGKINKSDDDLEIFIGKEK